MKKKTEIAIMGGSFNPITIGHIELAKFVLNNTNCSQVWINPCYKHMYNKDMVSPEHRLEMCKLAAKADGRIKIFDYEIQHKLGGETYHFVKRLLEESFAKDEYNFSYILGLDNANTFDKWVNYQDLERMIRFVVVSRKGVIRNDKVNWYLKQPHIFLQAENEIPEISSTQVRQAIKEMRENGITTQWIEFITKSVGQNIFDYIEANNLY